MDVNANKRRREISENVEENPEMIEGKLEVLSGVPFEDAGTYERKHVHAVYDAIAPHFSSTRYKPWPRVVEFLSLLPSHALVLDIGCGNGKYFAAAHSIRKDTVAACDEEGEVRRAVRWVIGSDYSRALLGLTQRGLVDPNEVNQERMPPTDVACADARRTPFRAGIADAVISIAVIHHYSTHERRREAVEELLRLVFPSGGQILIYVWAVEDNGEMNSAVVNNSSSDLATNLSKSNFHKKKKKSRAEKYNLNSHTGDALVKWEVHEKFDQSKHTYQRYYHFFKRGELESLVVEAARNIGCTFNIIKNYFDMENWCIIVERTA